MKKLNEHYIITKNPQVQLLNRKLSMNFWNNDCNLELDLLGSSEQEYNAYWKDSYNFELEIILKSKPISNTITLPIKFSNNVSLYKQEPDYSDDIEQPINVINSFAVYRNDIAGNIKLLNDVDLTLNEYQFETGKILHIYRPIAKDFYGKLSFCNQYIHNGQLVIELDKLFYETAVYPIVIDPTFGYTSAGGSGNNCGQYLRSCYTGDTGSDASGANLDSVSYYIFSTGGGTYGIVFGLYDTNGTNATTKNTKQTSGESTLFVSGNWYTTSNAFDTANSLAASNSYHFVFLSNQSSSTIFKFGYDTVSGYNTPSTSGYNYSSYPTIPNDVSGYSWVDVTNRRLSVYGTYTVSSGGSHKNFGKLWYVN